MQNHKDEVCNLLFLLLLLCRITKCRRRISRNPISYPFASSLGSLSSINQATSPKTTNTKHKNKKQNNKEEKRNKVKMAAIFLSNPSTFLPSSSSSSSASHKQATRGTSVCKPVSKLLNCPPQISKRSLSISLTSLFLLSLTGNPNGANAAILEPDDDLELMERIKKDRKKRIEKQTVLNSTKDRG